jgi:hypothetical protein
VERRGKSAEGIGDEQREARERVRRRGAEEQKEETKCKEAASREGIGEEQVGNRGKREKR